MKTHLLTESSSPENPAIVSRWRLRERAVELAESDGRPPQDASKADWEQAKRDLKRELGLGPKDDLVPGVYFAPTILLHGAKHCQ